jgi:hypothetical protein
MSLLNGSLSSAQGESLPVILDDEHALALNFRNGTLKLPSLELQPHRLEERLMKRLDYDYDLRTMPPALNHHGFAPGSRSSVPARASGWSSRLPDDRLNKYSQVHQTAPLWCTPV